MAILCIYLVQTVLAKKKKNTSLLVNDLINAPWSGIYTLGLKQQ